MLSTLGKTLALTTGSSMHQDFTSAFYWCLHMHVYLSAYLSLLPGVLHVKLLIFSFSGKFFSE